MFSPTITPTRPYPCDPSRHVTGRELWARLAARIARFVEVAVQEYHARGAMRRLRECGRRWRRLRQLSWRR